MKLSPGMQQYMDVKNEHSDAIVMFRMGDFYEMFYEDAKIASEVLGITLTSRGKGEKKAPLAGLPYHALDSYVKKFVSKGYKIALVEQLEDPKKSKGLVKRGLVRIITPGTIIEDSILTKGANNYISSIYKDKEKYGFSICDISTGEFRTTICDSDLKLFGELEKFSPTEIVVPVSYNLFSKELKQRGFVVSPYDDRFYWKEKAESTIKSYFNINTIDGLGLSQASLLSSGALLSYLTYTQKKTLANIESIKLYSIEDYMIIDSSTQRNLEILKNIRDNTSRGTLFEVINKTKTSMGMRLLKQWLVQPLRKPTEINKRLDGIEELKKDMIVIEEIKEILGEISDIERIISRVTYGSANARDLISLKNSLIQIPKLKTELEKKESEFLKNINNLNDLKEIKDLIEEAIKDEPSILLKEGNIIKENYNPELDELRKLGNSGKEWIRDFEATERENTGIKNLRVRYNKVFGYFIEVTKSHLNKVPENYIRKQTQVNAERYITEELKLKESLVLGAQDKTYALEYELFNSVLLKVSKKTLEIQKIAKRVAELDSLISLSLIALENSYVRPTIDEGLDIEIKNGRHPVVEKMGSFIANDCKLTKESLIHIITGPNMAGKSTYLRQTALIVLMAQMGSFVPAENAKIGVCDRIFSRVGAYDDLSMGQSTFMVEMTETANILNNATEKSLIIMDEVGRGTSTYDGLSLAWAIIEYIISLKSKTLFATHYHHLNKLEKIYPEIKNYNIHVEEENGKVVFLYKMVPGGTDKSYGIHVARIAGVPKEVVRRANTIIGEIESQSQLTSTIQPKIIEKTIKNITNNTTKETTNNITNNTTSNITSNTIKSIIKKSKEEKQPSLFEVIDGRN